MRLMMLLNSLFDEFTMSKRGLFYSVKTGPVSLCHSGVLRIWCGFFINVNTDATFFMLGLMQFFIRKS